MTYPVILPQLTETMAEAAITKWYKAAGERIQKGEILYQVETDKSTMDVESVDAGFLCTVVLEQGETAKVGQKIAVIADSMGEC